MVVYHRRLCIVRDRCESEGVRRARDGSVARVLDHLVIRPLVLQGRWPEVKALLERPVKASAGVPTGDLRCRVQVLGTAIVAIASVGDSHSGVLQRSVQGCSPSGQGLATGITVEVPPDEPGTTAQGGEVCHESLVVGILLQVGEARSAIGRDDVQLAGCNPYPLPLKGSVARRVQCGDAAGNGYGHPARGLNAAHFLLVKLRGLGNTVKELPILVSLGNLFGRKCVKESFLEQDYLGATAHGIVECSHPPFVVTPEIELQDFERGSGRRLSSWRDQGGRHDSP